MKRAPSTPARHAGHRPIALAVAALLLVASMDGVAQQRDTAYTVAERFSSMHRPEGVPFGAMRLYPRIGVGALHSDNVFASDTTALSDWAPTALGEAVLKADTSLYTAELGGPNSAASTISTATTTTTGASGSRPAGNSGAAACRSTSTMRA